MKTFLAAALMLIATPVFAEIVTIQLPKDCNTVLGSDFSAPSAESAYNLFELHCVDVTGKHRVYLTSWISGGSFFGLGRAFHPDQIILVPGSGSELRVE